MAIRTPKEITTNFILKEFNLKQKLALVGAPEFENIQSRLLKQLQKVNDLGLSDFGRVHRGCEIDVVDLNREIEIGGVDIDFGKWSDKVPLEKLECRNHGAVSVEYYKHFTTTCEGPF